MLETPFKITEIACLDILIELWQITAELFVLKRNTKSVIFLSPFNGTPGVDLSISKSIRVIILYLKPIHTFIVETVFRWLYENI